jgi:hypothetical protein
MQNLEPMDEYKKKLKAQGGAAPEEDTDMDNTDDDMDLGLDQEDGDTEDEDTGDQLALPASGSIAASAPTFTATPVLPATNGVSVEANSERPYMVITNLKKIVDQAGQLLGMIQTSGKVEQWAVDHITTSADDIEEVYNYYKYSDK